MKNGRKLETEASPKTYIGKYRLSCGRHGSVGEHVLGHEIESSVPMDT